MTPHKRSGLACDEYGLDPHPATEIVRGASIRPRRARPNGRGPSSPRSSHLPSDLQTLSSVVVWLAERDPDCLSREQSLASPSPGTCARGGPVFDRAAPDGAGVSAVGFVSRVCLDGRPTPPDPAPKGREPRLFPVAPTDVVLGFVVTCARTGFFLAAGALVGAAGRTVTTVWLVVTLPLPHPSMSVGPASAIAGHMRRVRRSLCPNKFMQAATS